MRNRPHRPVSVARLFAAVLCALTLSAAAFQSTPAGPTEPPPPQRSTGPREAVITLADGQRYTGFLVSQSADRIVLKIAGIDTPIPTRQIAGLSILPPTLDRYRDMRAAIDNDDIERLLMLAEWLRARSEWDTALLEIDHVLKLQPDNGEALRLKLLVVSQRDLALRSAPDGKPQGDKPASGPNPQPAGDKPTFPLLSPADINLIKVYEVDLKDPPRMVIARDAIDRLIKEHAGDPLIPTTEAGREALYRQSPAAILNLMFRTQARNLYSEVTVVDQPRSMKRFRDEVHRAWIINSCATSRCHGGPDAGRLQLYNQRPNTDATAYTNFLILERFRLANGSPLIDYEEPAKSPLLQLALPREHSLNPHPSIPGEETRSDLWRPFFRTQDDQAFVRTVDWIKSMYRPRPEYGISYTPPGPSSPPAPTNEPPVIR